MDEAPKLLLEELREELKHLHRHANKKIEHSTRITRFNLLISALVLGIIRFSGTSDFQIGITFVLGASLLTFSMIVSPYCIIVGSYWSHSPKLMSVPSPGGDSDKDMEADESAWIQKRIDVMTKRIQDYERRDRILSDALALAVVTGLMGAIVTMVFALGTVQQIQRSPYNMGVVAFISLLGAGLMIFISIKTIKGTRSGDLRFNRYSPHSEN